MPIFDVACSKIIKVPFGFHEFVFVRKKSTQFMDQFILEL